MRWFGSSWRSSDRRPAARDGRLPSRAVSWVGVAAAGAEEHPWVGPTVAGVVLAFLHLILFSPLPRVANTDFPKTGEITEEDIRAPVSFTADLLPSDVEIRQIEMVLVEPPVLRRLDGVRDQDPLARLTVFQGAVRQTTDRIDLDPREQQQLLAVQFPQVDDRDLERVLASRDPQRLLAAMQRSLESVMDGGVADMLPQGNYTRVLVAEQQTETLRDRSGITRQSRLVEVLSATLRGEGLAAGEAVWAASLLRQFATPNLIYDADESRLRQEMARQAVPTTREFIQGERIVSRGERITEQEMFFLEALAGRLAAEGGTASWTERLVRLFNRLLLLGFCLGLYGWLGRVYFPKLLGRPRSLTAVAVIMAFFLVITAFVLSRPGMGIFAVPIALLALLVTVLFRDRAGFATTVLAVGLLGILARSDILVNLALLLLGLVTVVAVRRIQKRSQFYQIITLLTLLSVLLLIVVRTSQGVALTGIGSEFLVAFFAPILSVALALFVLPLIEPLVGVSSDLTLLELSDLNHPLLQRMALEAPGTYHHSQVVGQLAEQAARAINANALQVRVGSLFHDIGKMQKAVYYVENQRPGHGQNKHDELSPSMSALVIASHVKDGIELAHRWRLPQDVIDFIPQHHGTQVMEYFYHKALEGESHAPVKVDDFRYPGPKPQRRETAILMLADAVEAATRSLAKPTPSRIKELTKQLCDKRMLSGELDQCNLTMADLARIRESFIPLLTGIHHARIAYPGQRERDQDRAAESRKTEKVSDS